MDLSAQYDAMRRIAFDRISRSEAELDSLIDSAQDTRRGLTLVARPPAVINARIETLLAKFRRLEPDQYYYPATDIHLTILSLISCYPGFSLAQLDPAAYQRAVGAVLRPVRPFAIRYAGLTASPGGIMVQGLPEDDSLEQLRDQLRAFFQHAGLPQSIDQRYRLQTAHSTIIRFKSRLRDPGAFLAAVEQYQHQFIGSFEVAAIELVFNDWYQRARNTVVLEKYSLGGR